MDRMPSTPRTALLAGATGLVGRSLLPMLLACKQYRSVHVLLRRSAPDIRASAKLEVHQVDFARLPEAFPNVDDVFIALGTTIKVAGSEAAFRQVDFDFVVNTARAARAGGATRLAVVSALGADARSRVFYNRVKGEMEQALKAQDWPQLTIVRPSLLLGERLEPRLAEQLAGPLSRLIPGKYHGIEVCELARAMWRLALEEQDGVRVVESDELRKLGK